MMKKERNNLYTISKLLNDFVLFTKDRSIIFLVLYTEVLSKILEWHFKVWKKKYEYSNKDDGLRKWADYDAILRILDNIIRSIEERALRENQAFSLFENFKKHIEGYKKEKIEDKNKKICYYIEPLFRIFYQIFFENIKDAPEKYEIWEDYFPEEWKITKSNLDDKDNFVSRISMHNFLQWAHFRIRQPKGDFDEVLEDAIENFFPDLEPMIWSRILIFIYSPYDPDNRIKSVIEKKWNFGFSGRGFSGVGEGKEEFEKKFNEYIENQIKNALELALFLFKKQFTEENFKKYIEDLKKLKYDKDSKEERRRSSFLDIFEKMLNSIQ